MLPYEVMASTAAARTTRKHFRTGMVLEKRYRLLRPLGEGGMGTVWVAEQLALSREVAIKSLHDVAGVNRERLRDEALALAAIHHPSVVQVFDYGETVGGLPFVVMELVRGPSLARMLATSGPLSATDAVALMLPLLEGLDVAHGAGIVHRDLKPDNVVMAATPGGSVPKLLDFGIAKRDRFERPALTDEGSIVGTPSYMAPEQVRGEAVDGRTDVWGAATLLYEAVAGAPPFEASTPYRTMERIVRSPPTYPLRAAGLDGALWVILTNALRKDPADRVGSAAELRALLAAWRTGALQSPTNADSVQGAPRAADPSTPGESGWFDSLIRLKLDR